MKRYVTWIGGSLVVLALLPMLTGCGTPTAANVQAQAPATPVATVVATAQPTATVAPEPEPLIASGAITVGREADLSFVVSGQIAELLVEEGAQVKQGDVLAILDLRPFDAQILQAEAGLRSAQAQRTALSDAPNKADVRSAQAQIRQSEIALAQARNATNQDQRSAESAVVAAQAQLQQVRDQLSAAKTSAELAMLQAVETLVQAQARYAQAKSQWEYVQDTGNDPIQPEVPDGIGGSTDNEVSDGQREAYYAAFVQAEAAMRQAEQAVTQAQIAFDNARQAEVTGIQATEQQLIQAQTNLDRVVVPENEGQVAAAQAGVELAQANLARLRPAPSASQGELANAGIAQAEAVLAQAQLNRDYATLRAPFDGVVTMVAHTIGELAAPGVTAFQLVDRSTLRFEAQVADFDIARVQVGQQVQVELDGFPGQTFTGQVRTIASTAVEAGGSRSFAVRVSVTSQQPLWIGMSGRLIVPLGK
jgi:multidrug resistance efflux pump